RSARRSIDPALVQQSIAVLTAYLEEAKRLGQHKPADMHSGGGPVSGSANGSGHRRMSNEEALDVLGLPPTARADEVGEAHRRLRQKVSSELGGTHYLTIKIDMARDLLLGD